MTWLIGVDIVREEDVVAARRRARQVAAALGFDRRDQTRIATAVSEIASNAFRHANGGKAEFALDDEEHLLQVTVSDHGPGILHLSEVLEGRSHSPAGIGLGIVGSRRLMDGFELQTTTAGTTVSMTKRLPRRVPPPSAADLAQLAERLAREEPASVADEAQHQNRELLAALEELRVRHEEVTRLGDELHDTNRGVLALHSELDEKAEHLRRADEMKSTFLSNMTHEFQTPLNSILALSRLLLQRADGELAQEQERQVEFIREAATDLSALVRDLLDLAKVDAGKIAVRPTQFSVAELFGALRGVMRPLQTNDAVALVFDAADALPPLFTDEGKLSQILRNYISNALKFTEAGEVRVTAALTGADDVIFRVRDTGIGIAEADLDRLFHEFGQVPNRLQGKVRGTGLGLSLSKRLAELLGGRVGVASAAGVGSTFWVRVPIVARGFEADAAAAAAAEGRAPAGTPTVLLVDDEEASRYVLRRFLTAAGCRVIEATGGTEGLARAVHERPDVVFLDITMPDMLGTEVLARLKRDPATAAIPVVIATSRAVDQDERARLKTHAAALLAKARIGEGTGEAALREALHAAGIDL